MSEARKKWETILREAGRAATDAVYFGIGFMLVPGDGGDPRRLHPKEGVAARLESERAPCTSKRKK